MIATAMRTVPRWKILLLRPLMVCGVMVFIAVVTGGFKYETASNIMFGTFIVTINVGWIYLSKLYKEARRRDKNKDEENMEEENQDQKEYKKRTDIAYAILIFSALALFSSFVFVLLIR